MWLSCFARPHSILDFSEFLFAGLFSVVFSYIFFYIWIKLLVSHWKRCVASTRLWHLNYQLLDIDTVPLSKFIASRCSEFQESWCSSVESSLPLAFIRDYCRLVWLRLKLFQDLSRSLRRRQTKPPHVRLQRRLCRYLRPQIVWVFSRYFGLVVWLIGYVILYSSLELGMFFFFGEATFHLYR